MNAEDERRRLEKEAWKRREAELDSMFKRNWNEFTLERKKQSDCESLHIME